MELAQGRVQRREKAMRNTYIEMLRELLGFRECLGR
jgi:hypothetical protein